MRRPSGETIAALVCAVLVGLLDVGPVLKDVARTGLDWPIWIEHPEGLMDTSLGKWWVLPPHHYLVDGSSGEFPIYYQSLSDSILNVIAEPLGIPAMTVQAVLFGPLLGFSFLLLNYVSLAAVLSDRRVALVASLLISLGGNSSFIDRFDPASGLPLNSVLHVPFHVISLATAQSLGWVLVLPCLSLTYLAYRHFSRTRAVGAGVLLATLFHSHTLTFVNVGAAQLFYLILVNALERPRDRRFGAWLGALALLAATFAALVATRASLSFTIPVALGGLALAATFLVDPNKRFYLWSYGVAGLLALPYVLLLARHAGTLVAAQRGWDGVQMMTVGLSGFVLFFAAYLLAAAAGCFWSRDRPVLVWVVALLGATAFLAVNHLWHWGNHPYRFAIHLLFPLAILAALGLRDAPRPLAAILGAWLCAVCVFDAGSFALGRRLAVRFRAADPERAAFLATVREVTSREEGTGVLLLAPVELVYPRGLVQGTTLMNYSRIRTFVPDYRHVLWRERYYNRVGLFCFLFPGYPSDDYPFGRRACDETLEPEPELVDDPRPAPADRDPAGVPDRLCRGPREALLEPPRAGRPALRMARRHPRGQRRLPAHGRGAPARPRATRSARLEWRDPGDRRDARRARASRRHPRRPTPVHARPPRPSRRPSARERPAITELGRLRGGALGGGSRAGAAVARGRSRPRGRLPLLRRGRAAGRRGALPAASASPSGEPPELGARRRRRAGAVAIERPGDERSSSAESEVTPEHEGEAVEVDGAGEREEKSGPPRRGRESCSRWRFVPTRSRARAPSRRRRGT